MIKSIFFYIILTLNVLLKTCYALQIKALCLLKRLQTTKIITRKSHSSLELENTWGRDATKIWSNQFFFFSLLIAFWLGPPTRTIKLIWVVDRVNFESALQTDWNSLHAFWRTIVIDKLFKETFEFWSYEWNKAWLLKTQYIARHH